MFEKLVVKYSKNYIVIFQDYMCEIIWRMGGSKTKYENKGRGGTNPEFWNDRHSNGMEYQEPLLF